MKARTYLIRIITFFLIFALHSNLVASTRFYRYFSSNQEFDKDKLTTTNLYDPSIDDGTIWRKESELNKTRLYGFLGFIGVFDVVGYFRLKELQYDAPTTHFHFVDFSEDIKKNKQMDKYGHVFDGYFATHLSSKAYRWSGISARKSILYGSITGWLLFLQVEMADAYFADWGFSTGDLMGNTVGVGLAAAQQLYPKALQGIRLKISYQPSEAHKQGLYSSVSSSKLDDYEGRTHWISFTIYDFLPEKWQERYPRWLAPLAVTVGQSVKGIATDLWGGEREVFVGLDIDLNKIPTGKSSFLKILKDELNFIRLPLPAVKITPRTTWYGFYF